MAINTTSNDWRFIEQEVNKLQKHYSLGLRIGNTEDQYKDTCDRWKTIGWLEALEWILKLPTKE